MNITLILCIVFWYFAVVVVSYAMCAVPYLYKALLGLLFLFFLYLIFCGFQLAIYYQKSNGWNTCLLSVITMYWCVCVLRVWESDYNAKRFDTLEFTSHVCWRGSSEFEQFDVKNVYVAFSFFFNFKGRSGWL